MHCTNLSVIALVLLAACGEKRELPADDATNTGPVLGTPGTGGGNGGGDADTDTDSDSDTDTDTDEDTMWYFDGDGDDFGLTDSMVMDDVAPGIMWVAVGGDCNDMNSSVNPGEPEVQLNGVDDDCNAATVDGSAGPVDGDSDGYDTTTDCDDGDPDVSPGDPEVLNNGVDDDCNAATPDVVGSYTHYQDLDGDGYGSSAFIVDANVAAPAGYTNTPGDCNDGSALAHPGGVEVPANGLDDDCIGGDDVSNPVYVPGTITMVIVNDGSYLTGATPSWETWAWNMDGWVGNWPGLSVTPYCGTGTTSTIECDFPGWAGDLIHVNGAWNTGSNWLIENVLGSTVSHISQITFDGVVYPVTLVNDATPPIGTCTCDPLSYDLYCQL